MADIDLTTASSGPNGDGSAFIDDKGTGTTADDLFIAYTPPVAAGTGNYDTFLSIHHKSSEEGFNTEDQNFLDSGQGIFTHSLLLADVGIENHGGVDYYVFRLDVNEPNNVDLNVTLGALKFYTSDAGAVGTDWNAGTHELGAGFTKIYDLDGVTDNSVDLTDHSSGSGTDDYYFYLPVSAVGGVDPDTTYLTLYAAFSGTDSSQGGFEEFRSLPGGGITPQGAAISIDKDTVLTNDTGNLFAGDSVEFLNLLVGTPITWTYDVTTGTSDVPIPEADFTVTDDQGVVVTPILVGGYNSGDTDTDHILDLDETWHYTATGFVAADSYVNIGEASGTYDPGGPNETILDAFDASGYFGADAQISIVKDTICGTDGDSVEDGKVLVGNPITWVYTVSNTGNVALSNVTVTDDQGVTPTAVLGVDGGGDSDSTHNVGDNNNNDLLDTDETWVFSAAGVATAGVYSNTGTASGDYTDDIGQTTSPEATDTSGYTGVEASIAIDKDTQVTADGTSVEGKSVLAGTPITWVYTVTNDGDVALANVDVSDDQGVVVSPELSGAYNVGDTNTDGLLDTDETWIFTATGVAGEGDYSNTGTATGDYTDDCGNTANPEAHDDSNYFGAVAAIGIDKDTICGTDGDSVEGGKILVGSPITWVYTVTNAGNVALSNVNVTDDQAGVTPTAVLGVDGGGDSDSTHNVGDNNNNDLLDTDETWIFSAAGLATEGVYSNTGTATGDFTDADDVKSTPDDSDTSGYTGVTAAIHLEKVTTGTDGNGVEHTGDGISIQAGTSVTWTYTVTNTGDVPLSGVGVTDSVGGVTPVAVLGNLLDLLPSDATHNIGDFNNDGLLDLTESWTFTATGTAISGPYSNTGTAAGSFTDDCGNVGSPTDDDGSSYTGTFVQSAPGLTKGYWYNHHGDKKQPNLWHEAYVTINGTPTLGVLLGDYTGTLWASHNTSGTSLAAVPAGMLFVPDNAAIQLINASDTSTDTRQILLSQALAAQLNIDSGDKDPGLLGAPGPDLISEAVAWLTGQAPYTFADGSTGDVDKNNDGILQTGAGASFEYNLTTKSLTLDANGAAAGTALTSNLQAWQFQIIYNTADGYGSVSANGEGLKAALEAFNTNHLVTSVNGAIVAWNPTGAIGGPYVDFHINGGNDFWDVLEDQVPSYPVLLHGILP
jgi:hypothetical protein